jgi:dCTP deaminase
MYLSDEDYIIEIARGSIVIEPPPKAEQLQPASIDLRLGHTFIRYGRRDQAIDVRTGVPESLIEEYAGMELFCLEAGEFALATTQETVTIPNHLLARVEGRSSLGRLGLAVHITAGFIDPGFSGQITLELYNHQSNPLVLWPNMRICQIVFSELRRPARNPYRGKYQLQYGAQPSRIEQDFDKG